ncbi:hypothetical protein GCM10008929_09570 [Alkalibacterium psychrotolerans]
MTQRLTQYHTLQRVIAIIKDSTSLLSIYLSVWLILRGDVSYTKIVTQSNITS